MSELSTAAEALELVPPDYFAQIAFDRFFGRVAPLEVDVGCGEGAFLIAMAARHPDRNFLGVERLLGRVRKTCRRAVHAGLENVRVLRIENAYAVRHLIPPGSAAVIHVMFPDPWPKRKHKRRRLVNAEFLDAAHAALEQGGELRLTTDDADYFAQMSSVVSIRADFRLEPWLDDPDYPQTDFEKRFRALGQPIHRLLLRKI